MLINTLPQLQRDAHGRFVAGNTIARRGYMAMVKRHFLGSVYLQCKYFKQLGQWNYEQQASIGGMHTLGGSVARAVQHPGPIADWVVEQRRLMFASLPGEVNFYE